MSELLPKLVPLKGEFQFDTRTYPSLVDVRYIVNDPETSGPTMRFGIAIGNVGRGPLHVILGDVKKENGKTIASAKQRIFNEDCQFRDVDVGFFELHEQIGHGEAHWHYHGLASLDLLDEDGQIVASSKKEDYCVVDVFKHQDLPYSCESKRFPVEACAEKTEIGISVGWADYYHKYVEQQSIELDEIKTGTYWLRFRINKTKLVHEESEPATMKIKIDKENRRITKLEGI